jgi:hypothetical protein
MILDKQSLFSDKQAITVTAASTNQIDLGATGTPVSGVSALKSDLGISDVPLLIQVTETFATLTSLKVGVQVDNDVSFGSPKTVVESPAVAAADLKAGYKVPIVWVPRGTDERYLRLYYTVAGSDATAGKITAGITTGVDAHV